MLPYCYSIQRKTIYNTPGTAGGPGGRDRTLAVKSRKIPPKSVFFRKKRKKLTPPKYFFCIYLLVMPRYWGKQIFTQGRFTEVGQKQKTEKKERKRERERKLVITMAKLRMAHASTHGARKPPGPKFI